MRRAPDVVGGARVIRWSLIDDRYRATHACQHIVAGQLQPPAAALAICQYEGEEAYYLFGCDDQWSPITDTWHDTLEEALRQAEFEYEGISATWNVVSHRAGAARWLAFARRGGSPRALGEQTMSRRHKERE